MLVHVCIKCFCFDICASEVKSLIGSYIHIKSFIKNLLMSWVDWVVVGLICIFPTGHGYSSAITKSAIQHKNSYLNEVRDHLHH
jgi:hypothetical protein